MMRLLQLIVGLVAAQHAWASCSYSYGDASFAICIANEKVSELREEMESRLLSLETALEEITHRVTTLHAETACKPDYQYYPAVGCLKLSESTQPVSHQMANETCMSSEGHLVTVNTASASQSLKDIVKNEIITQGITSRVLVWTDLVRMEEDGDWVWESTNETASWTNWGTGQPNQPDEHCMAVWCDGPNCFSWDWHNYPCDNSSYGDVMLLCQHTPWS